MILPLLVYSENKGNLHAKPNSVKIGQQASFQGDEGMHILHVRALVALELERNAPRYLDTGT